VSALTALHLHDFRSYAALELMLDTRPVVLFGANGAGKTNILEAISFLAPGRGMRRVPLDAPVRQNCESKAWGIHAILHKDGTEDPFALGTGLDPQKRTRRVRIDGQNAKAGALADLIRLVWLTPAQDRLFAGPRGARLRFFDRLCLSLHPEHGRNATHYERAMRDRQRLLDEGGADPGWLEACERQMASAGAAIMCARADTIAHLQDEINARSDSAFPQADLQLEALYDDAPLCDDDNLAEALAQVFLSARSRDGAAGRALCGPHKANLQVIWRAKAMPAALSSTGEQKALLIGLTLAHARAVATTKDTPAPLVLLDEACAHLDAGRRAALIDEVCAMKGQGWLTGTDQHLFDAFGDRAQFFEISPGMARAIE
jgi:DNA replication and repair protein RecF